MPSERRGSAFAARAVAAFAFAIPFEGLGRWRVDAALGMRISDWVLVVGLPILVPLLWRQRRKLVQCPLLWACVALSALLAVSGLVNGSPTRSMLRLGAMPYAVASVAAVADREGTKRIAAAVGWGGLAALSVSLAAYLVAVVVGPFENNWFVYTSRHPLYDGWPRLTGTFGVNAEAMGEYILVWTVLVASYASDRLGPAWNWVLLAMAATAELLTFSRAWVGVPLALMAVWQVAFRPARWRVQAAALAGSILCAGCVAWLVNSGMQRQSKETFVQGATACSELDLDHFLTQYLDAGRCRYLKRTDGSRGLITTYQHANRASVEAALHNPWLGVGPGKYREHSGRLISAGYGLDHPPRTNEYGMPHNTYLGAAAEGGSLGLCGVLLLLAALVRHRAPNAGEKQAFWLLAVALFVVATNSDLLHQRYAWLVMGLVAAGCLAGTAAPRPFTQRATKPARVLSAR